MNLSKQSLELLRHMYRHSDPLSARELRERCEHYSDGRIDALIDAELVTCSIAFDPRCEDYSLDDMMGQYQISERGRGYVEALAVQDRAERRERIAFAMSVISFLSGFFPSGAIQLIRSLL